MKNTDSTSTSPPNSYPLSQSQAGLLLTQAEHPAEAFFHGQMVIHIDGVMDTGLLNQSWILAAQKYDALRTSIDIEAGMARIHEHVSIHFQVESRCLADEDELDEQVKQWQNADLDAPFDLMTPPLWRVKVLNTSGVTRILCSYHYLIMDDLSTEMVFAEVRRCYCALSAGSGLQEIETPRLAQFIEWFDECPDQPAMAFWQEEAKQLGPAPQLPWERSALSARQPEEEESYQMKSAKVLLTDGDLEGMERTALHYGLSIEQLVQGAWGLLLGTYQGTEEAVLGITASGRSGPAELCQVVGCLIRTLPLKLNLNPQTTVDQWLTYLKEKIAKVSHHEHCTLAQIYGMSDLLPGQALFESVVLPAPETDYDEESCGFMQWKVIFRETHPPYPLVIRVSAGKKPVIEIRFDTRRYRFADIHRVAGHLAQTLKQLCTQPTKALGELRLIPADEWQKLIVDWNDTEAEYSDVRMQTLFENQVDQHPEAVALLFNNAKSTYAQVEEQANRMANYLLSLGTRRNEFAAILTERSLEMIPALFGVLKASAGYIPLDPGAPPKRWQQVLEAMGVRYLLTQAPLMRKLESEGIPAAIEHIILLDEEPYGTPSSKLQVHAAADRMAAASERPPQKGKPTDPAYVIFTSGTTGMPKGVVVNHNAAINLIEWVNKTFRITSKDRMLFITSLTFDLSVYDIFGILAAGGSIRIAKSEDIREPAELVRYIRSEPITFWDSAPAALMQILPFLEAEEEAVVSPDLRLVFMSGDWVPLRSPRALQAAFPNVTVVSLGGATEATVWSNYYVVDQVDSGWASIPYGRPIQNARYYVLDKSLRPCPLEVPGDLYIGGSCLSLGYANDPCLTSEKYLASPYENGGGRLYRTGDTVRWRQEGYMEFMGRTDTQVKIRGYRIELGEIDSTLIQHPLIQDSHTLVREDSSGNRSLSAFVILTAGEEGQKEARDIAESRVERWCQVYDNIDYHPDTKDDFSGWTSSYTGLSLSDDEMRAWRDEFVSLVLSCRPRRILEVGCGTGLIMSGIAPYSDYYLGVDFSAAALESAGSRIHGGLEQIVRLHQSEADLIGGLDIEKVDTVIINSVIQYFPNSHYLCRVLDGALRHVALGGRIIVGDIRSLPLLKAFHASVEEARSSGGIHQAALRETVMHRMANEEELVIDPAFFRLWAIQSGCINRVEIKPKCNHYQNEMSMFRYQAILHVGPPLSLASELPETAQVCWPDTGLTLAGLEQMLIETPQRLRITGILNARVQPAVWTADWLTAEAGDMTVAQWRDENTGNLGIDPDEVAAFGNSMGFAVSLDWSRHGPDGSFDALFVRGQEAVDERGWLLAGEGLPDNWLSAYVNNPVGQDTQKEILLGLRTYLSKRLPPYMVPAEIIALDAMPVTSSGKLDRRALLALSHVNGQGAYQGPRTITERVLVGLWQEVLDNPRIGITDSFFDLGGHSLLAVRLAMGMKQVFSVDVPVRLFFEHPTIAEVAQELVGIKQAEKELKLPPIQKALANVPVPASFEQQRIYFIDRLNPGITAYTINWIVPLFTDMDEGQVQSVLAELLDRYEILRTTLQESDGQVWQVVAPAAPVTLPLLIAADTIEAQAGIRKWWNQPFDVAAGPLVRALLVRIDGRNRCLAMSAHHTVFDGYSIGLFIEAFRGAALRKQRGEPIPAADGMLQYGDYAVWQHDMWLLEDLLQSHLDYWKNQLLDAPERLELPTDRPYPPVQSFDGDLLQRRLSPELSEQVQTFSSRHQVTDYITLLSVFSILLSRLSGQDTIVIGVPIANRNRGELEHMIGFLVSSVPLCIHLEGNLAFEDVIVQVRQKLFDGQAHQEVPLERLVELLHPERNLSYNPIFQVMCADESLPLFEQSSDSAAFDSWMRTVIEQGMSVGVSRFDLTLMIQRETDGIHLNLEYCTKLFDPATMELLMNRFEILLKEALSNSRKPVALLSIMAAAEEKTVLAEYVRSFPPLPSYSLDRWFREVALKQPDKVAVSTQDIQVTYGKLAKLAAGMADLLIKAGVGRGQMVGLCVPRSLETIVAMLGIISSGAAYVPLDPSFPPERLAFMIADSGTSLIVASRSGASAIPVGTAKTVVLEDVWADLTASTIEPAAEVEIIADDLACVMYTSGSTGQPKGAAITHQGILALGSDRKTRRHSIGLVHSPQAFDASTYEIWTPLLAGGRCHIHPPGEVTPETLRQQAAVGGLTAVFVTAALFHYFAAQDAGCFTGLKEVWTGGDAVHADAIRRVQAACPKLTVVDAYGPTEITVMAACRCFEPGAIVPDPTPIGQALDRWRLLVLDSRMQVVPVGTAGELYVGGPGLARGYVNRAGLTAEAFVADPFAADGSRLYRTGDRVRLLSSGDLEWLSRVDGQVKIRGFRVEPEEIEQVLKQHPAVMEAVVLVVKDGASKRLAAFVTLHEPITAQVLKDFVATRLPGYMVPGTVVPIDALPLGGTGKIDRKALAAMVPAAGQKEPKAARTKTEETLAKVWGEVLGLGRPAGIDDDFFALGGDSILSLQVVFRARQEGIQVTVKALFEHPTVADLALFAEVADTPAAFAQQGLVTGFTDLTPVQRWFFNRGFTNPDYFNQSVVAAVPAGIEPADWKRIIGCLLEHHDGLRTRFLCQDKVWHGEIMGMPAEMPLRVIDAAGRAAEGQAEVMEQVGREVQAGFQLERGSLFQAVLFSGWNDHESQLLLVAHHLVVDVISWRIIIEDIGHLAAAVQQGRALSLPEKTTSWQQWSARMNGAAFKSRIAAETKFWNTQLSGTRELPQDHQVFANTVARRDVYDEVLSAGDTKALLQEIPAVFATQINDVLLTAVAGALGAWCESDMVRLDLEGHGREALFDDVDVSRTVGWFTTISPVLLPVCSPDSLAVGLKQIKELMRSRPGNGIGYGILFPKESVAQQPAAQVSFNYLGQFDEGGSQFVSGMGMAGPDWDLDNERPYLIDIVGQVTSGQLHLKWEYCRDIHQQETIAAVAKETMELLRGLIAAAREPHVQGYSPADFPAGQMSQEEIDEMIAQVRRLPVWQGQKAVRPLLDCYPQTPVQQGLWFQSRLAVAEGVYHVQAVYRLAQPLDTDVLRRAWGQVMRRHPSLRTGFWEDGRGAGHQLVWDISEPPFDIQDWSGLPDRNQLLEDYLGRDRARGFDFNAAPQWRVLLVKTAPDRYQLIWSMHHGIIDGWSLGVILNDLTDTYDILIQDTGRTQALAPRPYRDYVIWLGQKKPDDGEAFWRRYLQGFHYPTQLPPESEGVSGRTVSEKGRAESRILFTPDLTRRINEFAKAQSLTPNTVLQGAFAVLLGRYAGSDDVLFGTVVSGRSCGVADIESMVGLFINTLPLRVGLPNQSSILKWLQDLQVSNLEIRQQEHTPLSLIRSFSELLPGVPLFHALFDFENYPLEKKQGTIQPELIRSEERIDYPIGLVVIARDVLELCMQYDTALYSPETVDLLLLRLQSICEQLIEHPEDELGRVGLLSLEEQRKLLTTGAFLESAMTSESTDLQEYISHLSNPDELELLERLLLETAEE